MEYGGTNRAGPTRIRLMHAKDDLPAVRCDDSDQFWGLWVAGGHVDGSWFLESYELEVRWRIEDELSWLRTRLGPCRGEAGGQSDARREATDGSSGSHGGVGCTSCTGQTGSGANEN